MNNKQNMSDDMLVKHLLGEATEAEREEVQQWIGNSAENRRYYQQFKLIWDESKKLDLKTTVDTDAAWSRFQQRVQREEQKEAQQTTRVIPLAPPSKVWMRIAAMLVVMIGTGWLIYSMTGAGSDQVMFATADAVMTRTLPDGSVVTLNKNSSISYPSAFEGNTRNVHLRGEAFFNVTPDKSKPFIIDAGNSSITVVGTSFNVKDRKDITEVIVESGIVEVAKKQKAVRLMPGQKARVLPERDEPVMEQATDVLYNYYRTNQFVCNDIPLHKFVAVFNEAYDVEMVIADPKLATLPVHNTFPRDLDKIVELLGGMFKNEMNVEKTGGKIILRAK